MIGDIYPWDIEFGRELSEYDNVNWGDSCPLVVLDKGRLIVVGQVDRRALLVALAKPDITAWAGTSAQNKIRVLAYKAAP